MTRLIRSYTAFRRSMQMSAVQFFVFVEGQDTDPYFYDKLCASALVDLNVKYRIICADRIAGNGGKSALITFYDRLRTVNSLVDLFQGKQTVSLFFLDKDLDDILHRKIFSDHIVYTRYYHVENYLFVSGDILEAACSAASVDRETLAATFGATADWRLRTATLWKKWVVLCLFAEVFNVTSQCNYRRSELGVNNPCDSPTNATLYSECKNELRVEHGGTDIDFDRNYARIEKLVNNYYRLGKHDLIFKGIWYLQFLKRDVESAMSGRVFSSHALKNTILASLRTTINFDGSWADHLRGPIRAMATRA